MEPLMYTPMLVLLLLLQQHEWWIFCSVLPIYQPTTEISEVSQPPRTASSMREGERREQNQ